MKKIVSFLLPVVLLISSVQMLYNYIQNGKIMFPQLCILFVFIPTVLEGIKPEISSNPNFKYFRIAMLIIGASMLVIFGVNEM